MLNTLALRSQIDSFRRQSLAVVRDVRTRWNYMHATIRPAELLQEAIDDWVFKTPSLRTLLLTEYEWKILREIADVLESKVPTISFVLPLYHKMEQHLMEVATSSLLK